MMGAGRINLPSSGEQQKISNQSPGNGHLIVRLWSSSRIRFGSMTRENDHHETVVLTGFLSAVALAAVGALAAVAGLSVVMFGP
jgi:hypothetical protein